MADEPAAPLRRGVAFAPMVRGLDLSATHALFAQEIASLRLDLLSAIVAARDGANEQTRNAMEAVLSETQTLRQQFLAAMQTLAGEVTELRTAADNTAAIISGFRTQLDAAVQAQRDRGLSEEDIAPILALAASVDAAERQLVEASAASVDEEPPTA